MHEPQPVLSEQAQALIAEEEALLGRVLGAVQAVRNRAGRPQGRSEVLERLEVLRDEATTAVESDLPALFQQIDNTRALLEREDSGKLPEPHAPYFAHLRLRRHGADTAQEYLLGRTTFTAVEAGIRIIDWRVAPVARVFYGYEEGDDYEEWFGERLAEGVVEARRLVVIERGVLTRIRAGALSLERQPDGSWRDVGSSPTSVLAGGAGTAVRSGSLGVGTGEAGRAGGFDVTAQLDPEQFEALTVEANRPLLVLGSAGSGKTTVALHRLARIASDPRASARGRMKVIVPEEGLARLSRRLLAPLELGSVSVETLDAWAYATACDAFGVKSIKLSGETPALTARLKRHPALRPRLAKRLGKIPAAGMTLRRLRKRLAEALTDRTFLAEVVAASAGDLSTPSIDDTVRHTMLQLATPLAKEFEGYHPESMQTIDGLSMEASTPDELADTVDVEDLPLLLFLLAQQGPLGIEQLAHVVLDEAEDFSLFELAMVRHHIPGKARSCTLAGDEMQQTHSSFAGWSAALGELGIQDAATCRLSVSYRCPRPVIELARHVLGALAPEAPPKTSREGVPVGFHHFPDEAQASLYVREALRSLLEREPRASVAVIASSPEAARSFYRVVDDMPAVRLVLEGNFTFEPGVDVTDVDSIKGLEFDYVILPDTTARAYPQTDEARRKLHVAITRTSHQLWVVSSGVRSRLLPVAS